MIDVIVHCSDSSFGNAAMIDGWHAQRGFDNAKGHHIGYHYVILNGWLASKKFNYSFDGHLETGRALDGNEIIELDEKAAAVLGKNMSVNICLIGKSNKFTDQQMFELRMLVRRLRKQYKELVVSQHSKWDKKKPYCAGLSKTIINNLNIML